MALNALIAAGGRNQPSPMQRYQQTRKDMNVERRNALLDSQIRQQMGVTAQKQNILQQEQQTKKLAVLGQYLDTVPEEQRAAAFEAADFGEFGLPPMPEGVTYEQVAPGIEQAKIQVFGAQEKWTPGVSASGAPVQTSSVSGKQIAGFAPKAAESFETVYDAGGKPLYQIDAKTNRAYAHPDAIKKSVQATDPDAFSGDKKVVRDRTGAQANVKKAISGMKELRRMVGDGDLQLGVSGNVVADLGSFAAQFRQLTGTTGSAMKGGKVDKTKIDPNADTNGWLKRASIKGTAHKALLFELAYVKAKAVGNDRITDKDFEFAVNMLEGGGDRDAIMHNLGLQIDRTIEYHNYDEDAFYRNYGSQGYKPMYLNPDGTIRGATDTAPAALAPNTAQPGAKPRSQAVSDLLDKAIPGN